MITVAIRTLNEKEKLNCLLKDLSRQIGESPEIIVIDNESSDGTPKLARKFGCKVITLPRDEFSYQRALNLCMEHATQEIVALTVGHARLFHPYWLKAAEKNLADPKIAGLYSPVIPLEKSSLLEKIFYYPGYFQAKIRGQYLITFKVMGVLGATNCAIRKSLWAQHHFDESFGAGGEDGEWAAWVMSKGYAIACDWRFSVRHSHGLNWKELKKQIKYWSELSQPAPFDLKKIQAFRTDLNFD